MILLIDNYDSFTYNLYDYFLQLGCDCQVYRNDEVSIEEIRTLEPKGIVISPGPSIPKDAGITMEVINAFHQMIPILGICLGHQAIGEYFGAKLIKAKEPKHGKVSIIEHEVADLFDGISNPLEVMRYHSLILSGLYPPLKSTSKTHDNEIMSLKHESLPIHGIQFHPESILTQEGINILGNWVKMLDNS